MSMKIDCGHWNIEPVGQFDPDDWYGFIYIITNLTNGRKYIGKKIFRNTRRVKVKGRTNRKRTIKDSNWREYTGSSKYLNEDIETLGKENFEFQIIKLCSGKSELTYEEESVQRIFDVLRTFLPDGTPMYYNGTIGNKNYRGLIEQTEETRKKLDG